MYFNSRFDLPEELQRLVFKGKQLKDDHTLFDYGVNLNDVIQVWKKTPLADETNYESESEKKAE